MGEHLEFLATYLGISSEILEGKFDANFSMKLGLRPLKKTPNIRSKSGSSSSLRRKINKPSKERIRRLLSHHKVPDDVKEKIFRKTSELFPTCVFLNNLLLEKKKYVIGIDEMIFLFLSCNEDISKFKERVLNDFKIAEFFAKLRI